jgi:hypothetical protein
MEQLTVPNEWEMISNNDHAMLHYFNEPERAGISPEKAAEMWKEKMVPLRKGKGKKIIGPGCASDPGGEAWLDNFMKRVKDMGEPPDYLGVHYYGPCGTAAIQYIEKMSVLMTSFGELSLTSCRHKKFPEYLVVISEIACISRDKKEVFAFTAQVANWCDQCPWVYEYSFFGCMRECADGFVSREAQLMNSDGTLTDLMKKLMNEQPMKGV